MTGKQGRPAQLDYTSDKPKNACVRLSAPEYRTLMARAVKKSMSVTDYMRWVLLRKHGEKTSGDKD